MSDETPDTELARVIAYIESIETREDDDLVRVFHEELIADLKARMHRPLTGSEEEDMIDRRAKLVFDGQVLAKVLGLPDDVHILTIIARPDPMALEVLVCSPRFPQIPKHDESYVLGYTDNRTGRLDVHLPGEGSSP